MVNCNLSNNKVFYFPPHKINNYLSLKKDPLRGRHIHTKNKYNYFIQIAIFDRFARGASWARPLMQSAFSNETYPCAPPQVQNRIFGKKGLTSAQLANSRRGPKTLFPCQGLTLKRLSSNSKSITISSGVWRNDSHRSYHQPTTTKRMPFAR